MWPLQFLLAGAPALLLGRLVLSKNIHTFAGPYIAFGHRYDPCPSDGTIVLNGRNTHFNPVKPFEKQFIWGNVSLKMPLDDSWWAHVNMAVRSNNEWKENAFIFHFPGGCCSSLREQIPDVFRVMTTIMPNLADKRSPCVFPTGEFEFKNQTISLEFPNFKIMPYGRYRFTLTLGKATKVVRMCLAVDCQIIPIPT